VHQEVPRRQMDTVETLREVHIACRMARGAKNGTTAAACY
jgi:hypothetical protein